MRCEIKLHREINIKKKLYLLFTNSLITLSSTIILQRHVHRKHKGYILNKLRHVTECDDGTFGDDCINNCSAHCLNNSLCNKQTGHCERGCKPGYTNDDCKKSM